MNNGTHITKAIRLGAGLTLLAALAAFAAREAGAHHLGVQPRPRQAGREQEVAVAHPMDVGVGQELLRAVEEGEQNGQHVHKSARHPTDARTSRDPRE